MLYRTLALVALFTCLNTAFAEEAAQVEVVIEDPCYIESMTLTETKEINCQSGDLRFAPGTVITTNGHLLLIGSEAGADLSGGLTIDSGGKSGNIFFSIRNTMTGKLDIQNADENGLGGTIEMYIGSVQNFESNISNGLGGCPIGDVGGMLLSPECSENSIALVQ